MDGVSVTIGSSVASAAVSALVTWLKVRSRQERAIHPVPLPVELRERFVGREEFDRHTAANESAHADCFRRLEKVEGQISAQGGKLDQIAQDTAEIKRILMRKALR